MLDLTPANMTIAVNTMTAYHRTGALPTGTPTWITLDGTNICIAYGYNGTQKGRLKFARKQFELTHVTNPSNVFVPLTKYNHEGDHKTQQDYINALKSNDLIKNQKFVSAMIILTSESCRSVLVNAAMQKLATDAVAFSTAVWGGLNFAFTTYKKTATFAGYDIDAGKTPWNPLTTANYVGYIASSGFTGDKPAETARVNAADAYTR